MAHVALKKSLLTAVHRRKRLQFAMAHADWTWVDSSIVLWSDESRFTLFQNDGPMKHTETVVYVVPTVKFGGVGCNVVQRN